jgi:lactate dehydrogenase-like 2-hydroxyacid dehydrogenase
MDAVDLGAAETRGIPVTNIRAGTADVADHATTLLLATWRMLPAMSAAAAAGQWDLAVHPEFRSIPRLGDSTVGIFGAGAIGRAVGDRVRAFGADTIATYRRPELATPELPHVDLAALFAESDAIVLTASLTPSSHRVVDRSILRHAGPGAVLVNVGRGALVVEDDLVWALDEGILRGVGLDVRDREPPDPATDRLGGRRDVIQTPHMAGVSSRALSSLHQLAADGIEALLRQGGRL